MSIHDNKQPKDLCFIDIETTGTNFQKHEIIDVGSIRTSSDGLEVRGEWKTRLRPRYPGRITEIARKINGFSEDDWSNAPMPSEEIWKSFADFANGCIPVCHNPSFERAFITISAEREGVTMLGLDYHWIGTETLAWPLHLEGKLPKFSLDGISQYFKLPSEPVPHSGINGAAACHKAYLALMQYCLR